MSDLLNKLQAVLNNTKNNANAAVSLKLVNGDTLPGLDPKTIILFEDGIIVSIPKPSTVPQGHSAVSSLTYIPTGSLLRFDLVS